MTSTCLNRYDRMLHENGKEILRPPPIVKKYFVREVCLYIPRLWLMIQWSYRWWWANKLSQYRLSKLLQVEEYYHQMSKAINQLPLWSSTLFEQIIFLPNNWKILAHIITYNRINRKRKINFISEKSNVFKSCSTIYYETLSNLYIINIR